MSETASPDGVVVRLSDYRAREPAVATIDDAFALWWASFIQLYSASLAVVEVCSHARHLYLACHFDRERGRLA